ncbi:glycosyltransferase family 2 protein [Rhabdobacter roseus]|uniref:Glycosyltransferase involved in cell wall biosynthesis n=1 Tax=Rhabdobacter roseus TaxID=1655419 RepID=A0A840TMC1_9BACT|nr:glycosyltransferase family 2 protein [Rhabdobacter roseus]MBB5282702.1 glycosyltransferase involved in cell wall biosynthesis [Rhabdobacter roseus]
MPLLTLITITYNAERYLERTLLSVQRALRYLAAPAEVEYLLVDGASTDGTLALAQKYPGLLSGIVSEPDRGLYDAMNKGQQRATGTYLWFLNAGDEIHDDQVLRRLLEAFQTPADAYYSDALLVRDDGTPVGLRSQYTPHTLPHHLHWRDLALGMKVCHQAFIVRHSLAPVYDITNLSADLDWEIECLKRAQSVKYLDFVLCRYLVGGLSVQQHRRSLWDRFRVLRRHFGLAPTLLHHAQILWRGFWFARRRGKYW